jgi:hypothetical protein
MTQFVEIVIDENTDYGNAWGPLMNMDPSTDPPPARRTGRGSGDAFI